MTESGTVHVQVEQASSTKRKDCFPHSISRQLSFIGAISLLLTTGCETILPPSPLTEKEAARVIFGLERVHPREKIYRQYVSDQHYFQFERVGSQNVIYGWRTCTTCNWTRLPISAIYDENYLYVVPGHHEDFFLSAPQDTRLIRDDRFHHWSWNTVKKYQVEGRNLVLLSQFRACEWRSTRVEEWTNRPRRPPEGGIDCRYSAPGIYREIWVATVDEVLLGERESMVDTAGSSIQKRLDALESLFRAGVITEKEYEQKRRDILDDI